MKTIILICLAIYLTVGMILTMDLTRFSEAEGEHVTFAEKITFMLLYPYFIWRAIVDR